MIGRVVRQVENGLAAIPFAIVAAIAFGNVLSRYFLNVSLAFTTEVTVNLVIWMILIGSVIGIREGAHLGFTALHDGATGRARDLLTVLITAAVVVFLLVVLVLGVEMVVEQAARGRSTPSIGIPQWLFTLALPVGAALGVGRAVQAGSAACRRTGRGEHPPTPEVAR